jgi:hypothetical protein
VVPATRAPKGLYDSALRRADACSGRAQGFNPGFQPWKALSKRICPEAFDVLSLAHAGRARDHGTTDGSHFRVRSGAPSGLFAGEIRFPGLKPWARPEQASARRRAESYSPFGATNRPKIFLNLTPFNPGLSSPGPHIKGRLHTPPLATTLTQLPVF